ncbi:MAG: glycosyltransferase, partial [Pseudomonadota bacterium]
MSASAPLLRVWDVTTASRVDYFLANSSHVARRIKKFYNRDSVVIHPPVSVEDFQSDQEREDFYLCAGQLVPYKRVDLAVKAFNESGRKLVVIGDGPQIQMLKSIAKPNVSVLGYQEGQVLKDHLSKCRALIFPGEEDFGITPVEAMASGAPVIAYGRGGARETVTSDHVGVMFDHQTVTSLNNAIEEFEGRLTSWNPADIAAHSTQFSSENFRERFIAFCREVGLNVG